MTVFIIINDSGYYNNGFCNIKDTITLDKNKRKNYFIRDFFSSILFYIISKYKVEQSKSFYPNVITHQQIPFINKNEVLSLNLLPQFLYQINTIT